MTYTNVLITAILNDRFFVG